VLLVQRAREPCEGIWSLPIGGLERGESPEQCAVREVQEETGLTVELDRLIAIHHSVKLEIVLLIFIGHIVGGEPRVSDEINEARLFDLGQLPPPEPRYARTAYNVWAARTNRALLKRLRAFSAEDT